MVPAAPQDPMRSNLVRQESLIRVDHEDFDIKNEVIVQSECSFIKKYRTIKSFFQTPEFAKISQGSKPNLS